MNILFGAAINGKRQLVINDVNLIIPEEQIHKILSSDLGDTDKLDVFLTPKDDVIITMTKKDVDSMREHYEKKLNLI